MYSSLKFWDFKPNFSSKALNCHYLRLTIRGGGDDTEQHHFTLSRSFLRLYFVRLKKLLLYVILTQKYKKYFLNQTLKANCSTLILVPNTTIVVASYRSFCFVGQGLNAI